MRKPNLLTACVVAFALGSTGAMADGEINLLYGMKQLDLDWPPFPGHNPAGLQRDWSNLIDEVEDQRLWGLMFTWGHDWPVALAVDYIDGKGDGSTKFSYLSYLINEAEAEVKTREIDVGVRKFWGNKVQGYVGGGAAWIRAENKLIVSDPVEPIPGLSGSSSDSALGFFLNGGVVWRAGSWFNLGLDVRYSNAKADLLVPDWRVSTFAEFLTTGSTDVGGFAYGLFVGGRF